MFRKSCWLAVAVLFLFSCSASRIGWKAESESTEKKEEKGHYLEDFDPLSLNDDDIVVSSAEKRPEVDRLERMEPEKVSSGTEDSSSEMVQGFRVQLLATKDEIQAQEAKKRAIFNFQESIYLVFEAPFYRLRFGDCKTRKEAEALRDEAVRKGFSDAWIVPSKVYHKTNGKTIY